MQLFDSANPLYTATSVVTVVSFSKSNNQGVGLADATVTGGAHITAFQPTRKDLNVLTPVNPTLTLTGVVVADTCTINGTTYSAVASGATGNQFNVGGNDTATAANLVTAFNANQTTGFGAGIVILDAKFDVCTIVTGTGTVSASMQLQASMNGTDWINHPGQGVQSPSGSGKAMVVSSELTPYQYMRSNITALSGTNARVQVYYNPTMLN
jgi:hypothetical protein